MPAIGTSSDQYQHRDPALTTYRRNAAAPTLAESMTLRSEERRKSAAVERRPVEITPPVERQPVAAAKPAAMSATAPPSEPVTPQRVVHELYAPPSRIRREHDDRHAMITGGTIDVRA